MAQYTRNILGVFVLEEGEIVDQALFPDDPETIAQILGGSSKGEELLEKYPDAEEVQKDLSVIAEKTDIDKSMDEIRHLQWRVANLFTEEKLRGGQDRDQLLIQAVRALAEIDDSKNSFVERLRAWYSLYFPEFEDDIEEHERFVELVTDRFDREKISEKEDIDSDSTGMSLKEEDKEMIKRLGEETGRFQQLRGRLRSYIEKLAGEVVPNISAVLGELLAARMISEAGSLEKLAKMPSSTIQVLGAEKALFRHMRGEGSAPKHGLLFMHPKVRNVSEDSRGKMARFIANKTAIAARLDNFGGSYKGDELEEEVEGKYMEIEK